MATLTELILKLTQPSDEKSLVDATLVQSIKDDALRMINNDNKGSIVNGDLAYSTKPPLAIAVESIFKDDNKLFSQPGSAAGLALRDIINALCNHPAILQNDFSIVAFASYSLISKSISPLKAIAYLKKIHFLRFYHDDAKALFSIIEKFPEDLGKLFKGNYFIAVITLHSIASSTPSENDSAIANMAFIMLVHLGKLKSLPVEHALNNAAIQHILKTSGMLMPRSMRAQEYIFNYESGHKLPYISAIIKFFYTNALQAVAELSLESEKNYSGTAQVHLYLLYAAFELQLKSEGRHAHALTLYRNALKTFSAEVEKYLNNSKGIITNNIIDCLHGIHYLINDFPDQKQINLLEKEKNRIEKLINAFDVYQRDAMMIDAIDINNLSLPDNSAAIDASVRLRKMQYAHCVTAIENATVLNQLSPSLPYQRQIIKLTSVKDKLAASIDMLESKKNSLRLEQEFKKITAEKILKPSEDIPAIVKIYHTICKDAVALGNPNHLIERCVDRLKHLLKHAIPNNKPCTNRTLLEKTIKAIETHELILAADMTSETEQKLNKLACDGDIVSLNKLFEHYKHKNNTPLASFNAIRILLQTCVRTVHDQKAEETAAREYLAVARTTNVTFDFYLLLTEMFETRNMVLQIPISVIHLIIYVATNIKAISLTDDAHRAITDDIYQCMDFFGITSDIRMKTLVTTNDKQRALLESTLTSMQHYIAEVDSSTALGLSLQPRPTLSLLTAAGAPSLFNSDYKSTTVITDAGTGTAAGNTNYTFRFGVTDGEL